MAKAIRQTKRGSAPAGNGQPKGFAAAKREVTLGEKRVNVLRKRRHDAIQGDSAAVKKQHEKGKLSARERIDKLLDPGTFVEFDAFALHRNQNFGMADKRSARRRRGHRLRLHRRAPGGGLLP